MIYLKCFLNVELCNNNNMYLCYCNFHNIFKYIDEIHKYNIGNRTLRVCPPQSSPSTRDSSSPSMTTMQCYLSSIPGFKPRKRYEFLVLKILRDF